MFTALAIGIHNFPEGIATFAVTLSSLQLGLAIAIAIAIHNIPEGISVAVPIYYGTGSKSKAMGYAVLSKIAQGRASHVRTSQEFCAVDHEGSDSSS